MGEDLRRDIENNQTKYNKELSKANKLIDDLKETRNEDLKLFDTLFTKRELFDK